MWDSKLYCPTTCCRGCDVFAWVHAERHLDRNLQHASRPQRVFSRATARLATSAASSRSWAAGIRARVGSGWNTCPVVLRCGGAISEGRHAGAHDRVSPVLKRRSGTQ